jgi:hypothetical protein
MTSSSEANSLNSVIQTKLLRWNSVVVVQQHTKDGITISFPILTTKATGWTYFLLVICSLIGLLMILVGNQRVLGIHLLITWARQSILMASLSSHWVANSPQLKARFNELMAVIKKMESEVPRRSGCNNEEDAEEFQLLLWADFGSRVKCDSIQKQCNFSGCKHTRWRQDKRRRP